MQRNNINYLVSENSLFISDINPRGPFRVRNPENKVRAPELAYKIVYGQAPLVQFRGRTDNPHRIWKGIAVDAELKDEWLNALASIPKVEIRSSCAGHNADRVAFVVFRTNNQSEPYIKRVIERLNKIPDVKAGYDIGNRGQFRICVATKNWYRKSGNNSKWEAWWSEIAQHISRAV